MGVNPRSLQAEGQGFDPLILHVVRQSDRVTTFNARARVEAPVARRRATAALLITGLFVVVLTSTSSEAVGTPTGFQLPAVCQSVVVPAQILVCANENRVQKIPNSNSSTIFFMFTFDGIKA